MSTGVSPGEYFTESPKKLYSEQPSTVKYQSTPIPKRRKVSSTVKYQSTSHHVYLEFLTPVPPPQIPIPPRWATFKPEIVYWPPLATEIPEVTKHGNEFTTGILSVVIGMVIFWIVVTGVVIRNKILAKRERRRTREPPSSNLRSNSALPSGGIDPSIEPSEMSDFTIIDIIASAADRSSSPGCQPSAPSQGTAENFPTEQPPSYAEIHQVNPQSFQSKTQEQPPSYEEVQLQRIMQQMGIKHYTLPP